MPKANVESAIKKASSKDTASYEEVTYEGYAPHGVALVVDTQTDNTTRTVSNLRVHFNKLGGTMGTRAQWSICLRKRLFSNLDKGKLNLEELEFELIESWSD
jgi:transcriptional/translational regulatory protein YebC/TACO1